MDGFAEMLTRSSCARVFCHLRAILVLGLLVSFSSGAVGQSLEDVEKLCSSEECTPFLQISGLSPELTSFAVPLESEIDFRNLKTLLKKRLAPNATDDVFVLEAGTKAKTEIAPVNPTAANMYRELMIDAEGVALASAFGLRLLTQEESGNPLIEIGTGLQNGFNAESASHLVFVGKDSRSEGGESFFPEVEEDETKEEKGGVELSLDEGGVEAKSFWQRVRPVAGRIAAFVFIGVGVSGVNTATIMVSSGAMGNGNGFVQSLLAGSVMGVSAATMNFFSKSISKWYGNGRWLLQPSSNEKAGETGFGRVLRMNSKRFFVGWTMGMFFRFTFRMLEVMPKGMQLSDAREMAEITLFSVFTGYGWAKVNSNLAREEGRPLPRSLRRIFNPYVLPFILTIAYQSAQVLYHVPGMRFTGQVAVGIISAIGFPFLIYQSIDIRGLALKVAQKIKTFARSVWCGLAMGKMSISGQF